MVRRMGLTGVLRVLVPFLVLMSLLAPACSLFGFDLGVEGVDAQRVAIGDGSRDAIVVVPEGHTDSPGRESLPLVVVAHGLGDNAEQMATRATWPERVAGGDFMAVFPQGEEDSWNAGGCCGFAADNGVDDIAFIDTLISEMVDQYGADPDGVHMTGYSNGAMLTYRYACERPDALVGAASVAGTNYSDCAPSFAIDFMQISGADDPVVPVLGGDSELADLEDVPSVEQSLLAVTDGAECDPPEGGDLPGVTSFSATGCRNDAMVRYDVIDGLGHEYPTAETSPDYIAVDHILELWGFTTDPA